MTNPHLPGKLGDPKRALNSDPRTLPGIVQALAAFDLGGDPEPLPFDWQAPRDALLSWAEAGEQGFNALLGALAEQCPAITGIARSTEVIAGPDGNDITLYISRPEAETGPLPGVLYLHGGGMGILNANTGHYTRLRDNLAAAGLVAISVEFRNSGGDLGPHPFPAGLNDCSAALDWMHENRSQLGLSKIIVSGESGGGNLTMATAIKAGREGRIDRIDGLYAMCPFVSNAYAKGDPTLVSLEENTDYFIQISSLAILSALYTPEDPLSQDPLAWPLHASAADLAPLPPTTISVNQLDPLRDEGLALFGKLVAAGVKATGRMVPGTPHSGDIVFEAAAPEAYASTIRDIVGFARAL
ncbi:alpha/beta hydrolase fold domain-containing protein [Pseudooceanicola sp.]|uniref:alpha/beta hydrolase fold domain-containing protein n=1 Tax=Pseudooceanicola sp. TaxID=1914328 RepID=UPI00262F6741|nr:alpha/beta hydrolase fold domain-containing protein [Pseudooceanicola sp.]MDF1855420.1 alpha/beta hydrolase fold domain-containing protein [Pseudooceanicola sp.]